MGSGSSKSPQKVTKTSKESSVIVSGKEKEKKKIAGPVVSSQGVNDKRKNLVSNNVTSNMVTNVEFKQESKGPPSNTGSQNGTRHGVLQTKDLGGFDSDDDDDNEEDDISAVLAATRTANEVNERNRRNREQLDEEYPETYAQRLQREQYRLQQQSLMRQKTIYRNPDEWEAQENDVDQFDIRKFKEVNVAKAQSKDFFEPDQMNSEPTATVYHTDPEPQTFSSTHQQQQEKKSLPRFDTPKYDMSEEALLAEIEQEYVF